MNLHDRIDQFLPARACDLGHVTIFVGHWPRRAEDHTIDGNGAEFSLLIDCRLLGDKPVTANNIRSLRGLWSVHFNPQP